jgi:putative phosphoesterase
MFRIGVISDTHNFLDPKIPSLFKGVDHILHGGDVGLQNLKRDLERVAPVTAVMGNTDDASLGYPMTEVVDLAGRKFLVHHIVNPRSLEETLHSRIKREKPAVVVFGHTHKPFSQTIDGILYFNPGYAGKSRFGMDRTIAILQCDENGIRSEYLPLR